MKKEFPQSIYRYSSVNKFLYESLIRNELWFNTPFDFNDPYDSYVPVDFVLESYKVTQGFKTDEEFINYNKRKTGNPLASNLSLEKLRKTVGVCCFSEVEDNLTMWSHYADNHKGILLKFDVSALQKVFRKIKQVVYTDRIRQINYENSPEDLMNTLLTRKSNHWKNEKEVRIIVKKSGHYTFPKNSLKEIRFGLKCDYKEQLDIIDIMRKFEYNDILFTHVHTTNYDYKLSTSYITPSREYIGFKAMGDLEIESIIERIKTTK